MKLNDRIPGLPKWPPILHDAANGAFVVSAKHSTYIRYRLAQWIVFLGLMGIWLAPFLFFEDSGKAFAFSVVYLFLPSCGFFLLFNPRVLSGFVFPAATVITFTRDAIFAGGKKFSTVEGAQIQFRASRPAMPEMKHERMRRVAMERSNSGRGPFELRFRRIEMIYGSRLIPITSVADEDRAEQFVVALQEALKMAKTPVSARPVEQTSTPARQTAGDALPE